MLWESEQCIVTENQTNVYRGVDTPRCLEPLRFLSCKKKYPAHDLDGVSSSPSPVHRQWRLILDTISNDDWRG